MTVGAALPVSAAADNVQPRTSVDQEWSFYISDTTTWQNAGSERPKENDTSIYFYWRDGTYSGSLALRVLGTSASGGSAVDCGTSTPGVAHTYTVPRKGQYSIVNYVYENGYRYARIQCRGKGAKGDTFGAWSPDSVGSYTVLR